MESKENLGDEIIVDDWLSIKGYVGGMTGSSGVFKVRENTYIGFVRMSLSKTFDELNVKYNIERSHNRKDDFDMKGNWAFKFNVKKTGLSLYNCVKRK